MRRRIFPVEKHNEGREFIKRLTKCFRKENNCLEVVLLLEEHISLVQ